MTEREYIHATNLAKFRIVEQILRSIQPDPDHYEVDRACHESLIQVQAAIRYGEEEVLPTGL